MRREDRVERKQGRVRRLRRAKRRRSRFLVRRRCRREATQQEEEQKATRQPTRLERAPRPWRMQVQQWRMTMRVARYVAIYLGSVTSWNLATSENERLEGRVASYLQGAALDIVETQCADRSEQPLSLIAQRSHEWFASSACQSLSANPCPDTAGGRKHGMDRLEESPMMRPGVNRQMDHHCAARPEHSGKLLPVGNCIGRRVEVLEHER